MRALAFALALLGLAGFAAPTAVADCVTDMSMALSFVESMPDGRAKDRVKRELKMAQEAVSRGDETKCLVHVGVCAQYTQR